MSMERSVRTANLSVRDTAIGVTRIAFGLVWAIDAIMKWQPAFLNGFVSFLKEGQAGQPVLIADWIQGWINLVHISPTFFALIVALVETFIALSLIFGAFSNLGYLVGFALSLIIWAVPEGFGGPYTTGATDIGTAIIYAFVFVTLFLLQAGQYLGMDRQIGAWLGEKSWLASAQ